MIDVTNEVQTKPVPRVNGTSVRDQLWHEDKCIGYLEPMGPVLVDRDYILRLVPSRKHDLEQRIYRLTDGDMAT